MGAFFAVSKWHDRRHSVAVSQRRNDHMQVFIIKMVGK